MPHLDQRGVLTAVAQAAGVSAATVSKVVHYRRDVGAVTRERVERLLDQHGYIRPWQPDGGRPRQIMAIFRDLYGPYTLEVCRGIVNAAAALGSIASIGTLGAKPMKYWIDESLGRNAAGIILVISMLSDADQKRIIDIDLPVVLIDPLSEPSPKIPSIGVTNWNGSREGVHHLIRLGHRRIGMLAGRPHSLAGAARLHGYRAALDEADLPFDDSLVRVTDFDYSESVTAARSLLRDHPDVTAFFASSDAQALGVLEAARRLQISVPKELSVVSFDDTVAAETSCPPLTAIRQPFETMGSEATRILLQMADGRRPSITRFELATSLTVRESTTARHGENGLAALVD